MSPKTFWAWRTHCKSYTEGTTAGLPVSSPFDGVPKGAKTPASIEARAAVVIEPFKGDKDWVKRAGDAFAKGHLT